MSPSSGSSKLVVAGGTYVEECVAPPSLALLGSGGRAALALANLEAVELHTFHPRKADVLANFGPGSVTYDSTSRVRFRYLHPLARPELDWEQGVPPPAVRLACRRGLRFGCVEGDFVLKADEAVYDPQGGGATFRANGSVAARLAVVLNEKEARKITGLPEPALAARALMEADGADVVVVKRGPRGAIVVERDKEGHADVPVFRTAAVNKIGSGDVFSAMFSHYWLTRRQPARLAAEHASRQVADYVLTRVLTRSAEPPMSHTPIAPAGRPRVLVVADTETTAGLWLEAEAVAALRELEVATADCYFADAACGLPAALLGYDVVLALPRTTTGIAVEVAKRARDAGVHCVGLGEVPELEVELARAGATVVGDFAASIYSVFWAAT